MATPAEKLCAQSREYVLLEIGNKRYALHFDNAAAFAFEEYFQNKTGVFVFVDRCASACQAALGESGRIPPGSPTFTETVAMIWALTRTGHPSLPIEKLREEISVSDYGKCWAAIIAAFAAVQPEAAQGEEAPAGADARPLAAG